MRSHFKRLYEEAFAVSRRRKLSRLASCGGVGAALMTDKGDIFTGTCIDTACSLGFCAEHSAIAEMLKNKQSTIKEMVAVTDKGKVLPACGRCRELAFQVDSKNMDAVIHLSPARQKTIRQLLPDPWDAAD